MSKFEKEFLEKYDSGYKFGDKAPYDQNELSRLVLKLKKVDTIYNELFFRPHGEIIRSVTTILKAKDRYFALHWKEGITRESKNEFYIQPYEVEKIGHKKIEIEWKKK